VVKLERGCKPGRGKLTPLLSSNQFDDASVQQLSGEYLRISTIGGRKNGRPGC
jgi:hypothetical protein